MVLTWSVPPGFVVGREHSEMTTSHKFFIVKAEQRIGGVEKLWMKYHLCKQFQDIPIDKTFISKKTVDKVISADVSSLYYDYDFFTLSSVNFR